MPPSTDTARPRRDMPRLRPFAARACLPLGLIVVAAGLAPASADAAASLRIARPANDALVDGHRMRVVVKVPPGATRFRASIEGRNVTRRFHPRRGTRVATLSGVRPGAAHLVIRARVGSKQRLAFARVYAHGRRDPRMLALVNANTTLLRHAADEGVARLAIRASSGAIVRATLNRRPVRLRQDFRTGHRLAVLNRTDGLRRGRNTLRLVAFTRDGRYATLTRSATIPRSAPMAAAGRDRRLVAGRTLRLDGRRSRPGLPAHRLTYRWRVVGKPAGKLPRLRRPASTRPNVLLRHSTTARPKVRLREPGRYTLAMTVTEHGGNGATRRSTDLLETTVAPAAPPTGAPIDTMSEQNGKTGVRIGTSPAHFYPAPPSGQIAVLGLDPKTLRSDPDLNSVIPNSGDVDGNLKAAVAKFTVDTILVVTGSDCCSASSKLLPKSGAFSYIARYDGNKDHFGQTGTWNRNVALTDDEGDSHAAGELNGVLRYQPSDGGAFRFIQDDRVPYSTSAPTESTLGPADGATYRILAGDGDAVAGDGNDNGPLAAAQTSSALSQQWQLQRAYGDYYRIVNAQSGLCMNMSGSDYKSVLQWACTGTDATNELWFVRAGVDGDDQFYTLEPASQPTGVKSRVVATMRDNAIIVAPFSSGDKTQRFTLGIAPGVYTISDALTGKLVGEPDYNAAWGTNLGVAAATGRSSQQWRVVDGPGGSFKLVNVASGLCMDVTGASTDEGTPIERYKCDPNESDQPNELWSAVGQPDGVALVAKGSGLVLSRQQNALVQRDDNDDKGQRWRLNRVSAPAATGGSYSIQAVSATGWGERRTVDATAGGPTLTSTSDAATQQWRLTDAGDGLVELYSRGTGKCLTPASGAAVSLSACDSDAGVWRADRRPDGTYALTNTGTGGGVLTAGDGTALSIADNQGSASQSWMLGGRPVTMKVGDERRSTAVPFGAAGFVVTAFDASRKPIKGTLTADDKGTIPAPSWPAAYVTNGTLVSDGFSLGQLLQGLAKQQGATVLIQSIGHPKPASEGWDEIATGVKELGGDPSLIRQLDGSGDYALVGCAGCQQATAFDEASRRAGDPDLVGARLQGTLTRNQDSTFAADFGSGVPVDSSLGDLVERPAGTWSFTDTAAGKAALNAVASQIPLPPTCNDDANLDPVRNSYCPKDVGAATAWAAHGLKLDTLDLPDGVDATTWAQVKLQLHNEWNDLDSVHETFQSLSSVYSSVASGGNATSTGTAISDLIRNDLQQPPKPRNVGGDVLNLMSEAMALAENVGPVLLAGENVGSEPVLNKASTGESILGVLAEVWDLAAEDDGATDAIGDTIQTQASDYATSLDLELGDVADDLSVIENALVSEPVRLQAAGDNADQAWKLPETTYTELKDDLKAGLARSLWTKLLPAAYEGYQFPLLPSGTRLQTMYCVASVPFKDQPDAAVFSWPTSFNGVGDATGGVTMTLSPKTVKDDLGTYRHVGSNVLNALYGAPASGTTNGGFSSRELVGQTGLDVVDQTAPTPSNRMPPISLCQVSDQNRAHTWQWNQVAKSWLPYKPIDG